MPGMPAVPKNNAYSDQARAARTPTLTSVSMVAAPWWAFTNAARWNGQAPHTATGAARVRVSQCQLVNCRAGTIDRTSTGTVRMAEMISRWRSEASWSGAAATASATGGAGNSAEYPADSTVAISCSAVVPSATLTRAFSVA